MAGFDPSVISQIPDNAPNPLKATQDAYSLYDSKNRVQMNALTLQNAKENEADRLATKKILQGSDLSTDRGVNDAAAKIQRVSPDMAMKFKQDMTTQKGQNLDLQLKQIQVAMEQQLPMLTSMDSVIRSVQPMKDLADQGKITRADLDALVARKMMPQIQQLAQEHPELAPYLNKYMQNPKALTYDNLISQENQSKQGREMLKQHEQEIKDALNERRQTTSEKREEDYSKSVASLINRRDVQNKKDKEGEMDMETARDIAREYRAGNKSAVVGLGRTANAMVMVRRAIRELDEEEGKSVEERVANMAKFNAIMAEERKIGGIAGAVEFSAPEIERFAPLALDASSKVKRGNFVPLNKLVQMGETSISDPNLKQLRTYMIGLMNAYDVLAARGGSDKEKRAEIHSMFNSADGPRAVKAVVDAITKELENAKAAGKEAKENVASEFASSSKNKSTGKGNGKSKDTTSTEDTTPKLSKDEQSTIDYLLSK